jgi:hypothetical protein
LTCCYPSGLEGLLLSLWFRRPINMAFFFFGGGEYI